MWIYSASAPGVCRTHDLPEGRPSADVQAVLTGYLLSATALASLPYALRSLSRKLSPAWAVTPRPVTVAPGAHKGFSIWLRANYGIVLGPKEMLVDEFGGAVSGHIQLGTLRVRVQRNDLNPSKSPRIEKETHQFGW
jgi:hypothetical protein